jgi:hypothetical protein
MKKITLILVFTVLFIGVVAGAVIGVLYVVDDETASTPTPTPTANITPPPTPTCEASVICITPSKLCADYNANELAADHDYKGKILDLSARIEDIDREPLSDRAYLTMDCGIITDVWCYFDKAYESQLIPLKKGDYVVVRGTLAGKDMFERISLEHCTSAEVIESAVDGGDDGWCFIATAAYGSYMDDHVNVLRQFRDSYMMTNPTGRGLVSVYYSVSPPLAQFIDDNPSLKPVVRAGLWPVVTFSTVAINTTLVQKMAIAGGLALLFITILWLVRRRAFRRLTD